MFQNPRKIRIHKKDALLLSGVIGSLESPEACVKVESHVAKTDRLAKTVNRATKILVSREATTLVTPTKRKARANRRLLVMGSCLVSRKVHVMAASNATTANAAISAMREGSATTTALTAKIVPSAKSASPFTISKTS